MSGVLPAHAAPGELLCPRCGHSLRDGQAWCLECGLAARTRIHPPPSPRGPVALVLVVLALLAAGIAVGLVTLLDTSAPTPAATTVTVPATSSTPATITAPTATTPAIPTTPLATIPTTTAPPTTIPTVPGTATTPGSTTPSRTFTVPGTHIVIPIPASSR
ncbi:MAG TPA: hypothetical protein VE972_14285 [Conexibacter sp.]|nr:hypothetical protein [Conexibacter sp.]